jgi:hypothetical protein
MERITDYFGTPYNVGDTIEFQCLIACRKHRSRSKVYGFTDNGPLVSANGFRKTFQLKWGEVIKKVITK